MKKLTIQEELEMLRAEVEQLRKDKEVREEEERAKLLEEKESRKIEISKVKDKADTKEAFTTLLDSVKKDYDNLSPSTAVLLFALGALFGSSLSSK